MNRITEVINAIPEFMWNNIFTVINTLVCGLIVALFTSTFLKKKEERTRIAGVIVEKRINSEQEVLHFLEHELFKEEINIENNSKYDFVFDEVLKQYGLPTPYSRQIQYARIFTSPELFERFFHNFEDQVMNHKLWLDTKVKEHLVFMQLYFGFFNMIPLLMKRIPLPKGKELSNEEFEKLHKRLLLLLGHCCDNEINELMSELDEKIVDSVYKLELTRPKKSIMRDNMFNVDMRRCMRRIKKKTIPGLYMEKIFELIEDLIYQEKKIDDSKMSDEEFEEFLKSSMPREYKQMKAEADAFDEMLKMVADECGVKIVSRSEAEKYPDMYGISLKDALEGKKPTKIKKRKGNKTDVNNEIMK